MSQRVSPAATYAQSPTIPTSLAAKTGTSGIDIDGQHRLGTPYADHVVEGPGDAEGDVKAGLDGATGNTDLAAAG